MSTIVAPVGGDQDRGSVILGLTWTLTLISVGFVSLRMYTRFRLVRKIWWDDWLAVIAVALASPLPILWTFYVRGGGARHLFYLSPEQRESSIRLNWISQPFGIMAIALAKAAVAFLILRFQAPNKWRTRALYFIAISITLLSILNCILTFVQCSPPRALWRPELLATGEAHCWAPKVFEYYVIAQNSYSVSLDFVLVAISTTIVWNLQISFRRRVQLVALLSTGILDGVFGIIKTTKLPEESARSDYTWNTYPLFLWTIGELHGIIIGSCLPTLRPLYLVVFKRPGCEAFLVRKSQTRGSEGHYSSFKDSIQLKNGFKRSQKQRESLDSNDESGFR